MLMGSNPGGIELQIPSLVANLHDYHPIVYLIHGQKTIKNCVLKNKDITLYRGENKLPGSALTLFRFARRHHHHIFHVFNIGPVFLLTLRLAGVKNIVYSIRGTVYGKTWWRKLWIRSLWKLALTSRPFLISNSDYSAAMFQKRLWRRAQPQTIYNPIDTDVFYSTRESYPSSPRKIAYVGRLAKGKNVELWIELAKNLGKEFAQMEFHIHGDGPLMEDLKQLARDLGMEKRIIFHGFTQDVAKAYRQADLTIFLSQYESFGNVVVESILAGTPVLCSDIPSLREIFAGYPEFLLPLDANAVAEAQKRVQLYPKLVELTLAAQKQFKQNYSIQRHTEALEAVYRDLIS